MLKNTSFKTHGTTSPVCLVVANRSLNKAHKIHRTISPVSFLFTNRKSMKGKERMGVRMGLNLLLLHAMVAANILSFYHLSSSRSLSPSSLPASSSASPSTVPDHLLRQLHTIRATITHLSSTSHPSTSKDSSKKAPTPPPALVLYSQLFPIVSACSDHPNLLHRFMSYSPFSLSPRDLHSRQEPLLRGCHPFPAAAVSPTPPPSPLPTPRDPFSPLLDTAVLWPPTSPCRSFSASRSPSASTRSLFTSEQKTHGTTSPVGFLFLV